MKGSTEKWNDKIRSSAALFSGSQYLKVNKDDDLGSGKDLLDSWNKQRLGIPLETPSKFIKQYTKEDQSSETE